MTERLTSSLSESYNKKALERDLSALPEWKLKERDIFLQHLKGERIINLLEIGSGTGKDSKFFSESGLDTFSTDISEEMVKLCMSKGLNAKVMSFENLEFKDNTFESVWSMNCLLHVPKKEIKEILQEIKRVLKPSGLFYMGVYGGEDFEGIWEEDSYDPKRFFSFYKNDSIKEVLSEFFEIEYFNIVPKEIVGGRYHFQSIILRK